MAEKIYNNFVPGVAQDDWQTGGGKIIEGYNVTGLTTGYGITLGPKSNKLFTTNGAMRGIFITHQTRNTNNAANFAYGDGGEIYNFNSSDLTPLYTTALQHNIKGLFVYNNEVWFLEPNASVDANNCNLGYSTNTGFTDVEDIYNPAELPDPEDSEYKTYISNVDTFPSIITEDRLVIGGSSIVTIDPAKSINKDGFYEGNVVGLARMGTQYYLYTDDQEVVIWDGISEAANGNNKMNFPIRRIRQLADRTYAVSRDGEFRLGNGYQFSKISKTVQSDRLNDNSDYQSKFDFGGGTDEVRGQYIANAGETIYVGSNEDIPGVYIYDNIIEGTPKGLHKAITTIHDGTQIDEIYAIEYDHTQDRVFYSYKAGTTYGIDYISTTSRETQQSGYLVTEIFSSNTSWYKIPKQIRLTTSNTSGNNYVKLYERVNNTDWNELKTINNANNIIDRTEISKYTKNNIDVQFKIELFNDNQGTKPPILHELYYEYDIIPK